VRRIAAIGLLIALLGGITVLVLSRTAEADVKCKKRDLRTGVCLIEVTTASGSSAEPEKNSSDDQLRRGRAPAAACVLEGATVPCRSSQGSWSNGLGCYLKSISKQLPKSDAAWEGRKTGNLYWCSIPPAEDAYPVWLATRLGAPPPPDPRVLALQAVAAMGLRAIDVGIVPEARPGSIGIIGLPTWMWVDRPGQHTWGPISRTVSAGGYSVTATARVKRVVWAMGDGSTVVCVKRGTPYADSFGRRSSPDCGHTYTRQGVYTVRATSYWLVTWSGIRQAGSIPLDFTRAVVITMGEAQVLTR
jgi:hypothetical protein